VRRGYFVEGLSGAQFALPDAARLLQDLALPGHADAPVVLIHSLDPASLFGSGAPFQLPIPEEEVRTFSRRGGNWLAIKSGRPILLIEQHGKRLTAMPNAALDDLRLAVARLTDLLKWMPNRDIHGKITVETWNNQPITSTPGIDLLAQAGFVRDYLAMTLYGIWS
jgi:ATP-dependent helicase Lhr and Lhr-like helicase